MSDRREPGSDVVTTTTDDHITIVTINRPERRNALSNRVLGALHRTFDEIAGDPTIRVVVVTGAGTAFCAGADMKAGPEDMTDTGGSPTGDLLPRLQGSVTRTFASQEHMASLF